MRTLLPCCLLLAGLTMASAADPLDVAAITKTVVTTLEQHQTIEVNGTVTTTTDGNPLSTSVFSARFKRPNQWLITWQDSGFGGTFKPGGVAWGNGTEAHLRFTGQAGTQTSPDTDLIIATATGISHSLTFWLYALFQGETANVIPATGTAAPSDHGPVITGSHRPGYDTAVWIVKGLITNVTTTTDSRKIEQEPVAEMTDEEIAAVLKTAGKEVSPAKVAELRAMLAKAEASWKGSTTVFRSVYTFSWSFDMPLLDKDLSPDQAMDSQKK